MQQYCHRCGEQLPEGTGESPFCPHCGAPQLFLALEKQSVETGGEAVAEAAVGATTGAAAPPRPRQVEWQTAIRCAVLVAGIASLLTLAALRVDILTPVSFAWIAFASLITLGLYQRRKPAAWIDMRVGARIGVVVGLCLALGMGMAMGAWGLVARYGLHSMGSFDAQMADQVMQVQKAIQQKSAEQSTPVPTEVMTFMKRPEFRAGIMLATFAMVSTFLLALSTLGGALAGLLRMRRGTMA